MKRHILFSLFSLFIAFTASAQLEQYNTVLKIFPDTINPKGCYVQTDEAAFIYDTRNMPGWVFNMMQCQKTEDLITYFPNISEPQWKFIMIMPGSFDRIFIAQEGSDDQSDIQAELEVMSKTIAVDVHIEKIKPTKGGIPTIKLSFNVNTAYLTDGKDGTTKFEMIFSPKDN
ncbi:MAG: hypothetical protein IT246_08280 [Bacteroidia bacterium]|nr:hypothetical protein [Bacteroidia bacterium]